MSSKLPLIFREHRKPGEKDVFTSTQNRLTLTYSGLLMLFLVLFIVIVFAILYFVILNDQERELESLAGEEARAIKAYLKQDGRPGFMGNSAPEIVFAGADQFFYYVISPDGEVITGSEAFPPLRGELLSLINKGAPGRGGIRREKLNIDKARFVGREINRNGREIHVPAMRDEVHLMIAGNPLILRGREVGTLYVGKDVSFAYDLFKWLFAVLGGIALIFVGLAVYISFLMSKKAMFPISKAFSRQRTFVADASHELRTPLSVMLSSINAMEMTTELQEDEYSRKLLYGMKDEVKRMTNLVGDMLTLARSDSDQPELNRETFDFKVHAQKAVESVGPLAAAKEISLKIEGPDAVPAEGDPERLRQLLIILLDNAIKYTGSGGRVVLRLTSGNEGLYMQVQDTGIGIQPGEHKLIFERFYRSDTSRSRKMGSHGLGLAIAKWIVDSHGGSIEVESEAGKGSTFTVRIPFIKMKNT
ncbi:ATP-binding protein [Peribacillus sp. SCS-37]|uniref:ATP-binding protein n=1 Tax=Paraperibacillus esterisolvens TaxID=3115296 RepID=UPI00390586C8